MRRAVCCPLPGHSMVTQALSSVAVPIQLFEIVARPERFELPTLWFVATRSIQLSYGRAIESEL
jgi:hypothetical protein